MVAKGDGEWEAAGWAENQAMGNWRWPKAKVTDFRLTANAYDNSAYDITFCTASGCAARAVWADGLASLGGVWRAGVEAGDYSHKLFVEHHLRAQRTRSLFWHISCWEFKSWVYQYVCIYGWALVAAGVGAVGEARG